MCECSVLGPRQETGNRIRNLSKFSLGALNFKWAIPYLLGTITNDRNTTSAGVIYLQFISLGDLLLCLY